MVTRGRTCILVLCTASWLCGCANPLNLETTVRYSNIGHQAEQDGDIESARDAYRRAALNANLGNVSPDLTASALYEYGGLSAYMCDREEAERSLKASLDVQNKNPEARPSLRSPTLFELARLLYDTSRKQEALPFYEEGIRLVRDLDVDPWLTATVLDEFAACLTVAGRLEGASEQRTKATRKRSAVADSSAPESIPRYSDRCSE